MAVKRAFDDGFKQGRRQALAEVKPAVRGATVSDHVLMSLARTGKRSFAAKLATELGCSKAAMSEALRNLHTKGFVTLENEAPDKAAKAKRAPRKYVRITKKGRLEVEQLGAQLDALKRLLPTDRRRFKRLISAEDTARAVRAGHVVEVRLDGEQETRHV